ncbi:MAG: UPF0149 family protein [Gammaproteobacteria bacterium]|nr:UPF0149 family protein [Gammaproteobacteria bacterium]MCF6231068.1 UPF0149 family protein [Gammaproteobacteria bacterium]
MASKKSSPRIKAPHHEMLARLSDFLTQSKRPKQTLCLPQLQGFLFAVSCAPTEISAEDWLPVIFNEQDPGFQSDDEADAVLDVVMTLYNYQDQQVEECKVTLPDHCQPAGVLESDFSDASPFSLWCSGFLIGHGWLESCWEGLDSDLDEVVGSCMMVLAFYAERELANSFYTDFSGPDESFEAMAEAVLAEFDEAMVRYADVGALLRSESEEV